MKSQILRARLKVWCRWPYNSYNPGRTEQDQSQLCLKGVFAKNEKGYRLNAIKKALLIANNLTSICCVYKEKIVKDVLYTE